MMLKPDVVWVEGPAGRLETIYIPAQGAARGVAVVNHPNPTQGGTNTNKVIQTAAKALSNLGFHCYLPNLRGVGGSGGEHDYGRGETDDCVAVIDFARSRHPELQKFVLSGFSFGGYVSLFAAHLREPDLLLLIGPAVKHYERPEPVAPDASKTLLIHGAKDDVVHLQQSLDWAAPQNLPVIVVPEASHFFHGKLMQLRDAVARFAPSVLGTDV